MQNRQITPCSNCGEPVEIVPAGVSKTTGKPYGSFWACKACGKSQNVGPQPPKSRGQTISNARNPQLDEIIRLLSEISRALKPLPNEPEPPDLSSIL